MLRWLYLFALLTCLSCCASQQAPVNPANGAGGAGDNDPNDSNIFGKINEELMSGRSARGIQRRVWQRLRQAA